LFGLILLLSILFCYWFNDRDVCSQKSKTSLILSTPFFHQLNIQLTQPFMCVSRCVRVYACPYVCVSMHVRMCSWLRAHTCSCVCVPVRVCACPSSVCTCPFFFLSFHCRWLSNRVMCINKIVHRKFC